MALTGVFDSITYGPGSAGVFEAIVNRGGAQVTLTGLSISVSNGLLTGPEDRSASLTGYTIYFSEDRLVSMTGRAMTFASGTLTPVIDYTLTGIPVTLDIGHMSAQSEIDGVAQLQGIAIGMSSGSLFPAIANDLTGAAITADGGALTPQAGHDLTSLMVSMAAGQMSVPNSATITLSGLSLSIQGGSLIVEGAVNPDTVKFIDVIDPYPRVYLVYPYPRTLTVKPYARVSVVIQ